MSHGMFSRAGRIGRTAIGQRAPELKPLYDATICIFGLGCLGAPSAMEFARCGVKNVHLVDFDFVDPAATGRWPFGLQSAGLPKSIALANAIGRDYPFTRAVSFSGPIGAVRDPKQPGISLEAAMSEITSGASVIYDATAEVGVQHFLSDYAAELGVPYIVVEGTAGGWGGMVARIMPGTTAGCWLCLQTAIADKSIPEPPQDSKGGVQPAGCAELTFTGTGFDLTQIALTGVRTTVSTLCTGTPDAYPPADWDVTVISFRDDSGKLIPPLFQGFTLHKHDQCPRCNQN
jgi:molybdopterin/thiamine biosynthesis adenylyltransferase